MDVEYLQALWQKDEGLSGYRLDETALQKLVRKESRRFERYVRWRDWYELVGGVVIGSFFLYATFFPLPGDESIDWTVHWDRLLLASGCYFIALVFGRLRLASRAFREQVGDSLLETLQKRKAGLEHQIRAVRGILRWYILPVAIPLGVMVVVSFAPERRVPFVVTCLVAMAAVVVLNRRYAKRKLQPKLDSVNDLIEEVTCVD